MPRCPNCSYKLVLLSNRPKYKCALCSKLYTIKEIELKDFLEFNKNQRVSDIELHEKETLKRNIELKSIKQQLRQLFSLKLDKKQYAKEYYQNNKEVIKTKSRQWRLNNLDYDRQRKLDYYYKNQGKIIQKSKSNINLDVKRLNQTNWRNDNRIKIRSNWRIQYYKTQQKLLALQYLENEAYRPQILKFFDSVSRKLLADLLEQ